MDFHGIDLTSPINRIRAGFTALSVNVRAYLVGGFTLRTVLTDAILTVSSAIQTVVRLNDSTPAGPVSGFTYILAAGTSLFAGSSGTLTAKVTGMSGNPVSVIPFRPNTSVQPWAYVSDSAANVFIVADSFNCPGMLKVRSDGLVRKRGIAEPQTAGTVAFPGGGSGPSQIFYFYTYYATETGAESNPAPVSIPGTNAQANPTVSIPATSFATNYTFNAAQYEFNAPQIRTKGGVAPGTTTDYVVVKMGSTPFSIPAGVNIDGIQVDLNWVGQNSGTGVLSGVQLYYLGSPIGNAKEPGIQNQSFSSDTFQGGSGDVWGATLTPAIVNDPTFGFGAQITTQLAGGSDRSFINFMAMTVFYSTQNANLTPVASLDPQVNRVKWYRQGGGLVNPTFVGAAPNTATVFNDTLSDLAVASNPLLQFDNFEPYPSIDLPRSGLLTAASQVLTSTSGDPFNIRWLPGTIILIGGATQVAYTAPRRPTNATTWNMVNNDPTVPVIPDGTGLQWNIAEPPLAAQPLPYEFGLTDNINFTFAMGDELRPGTLYWPKGNNLDSAPDTNQMEVTDPGEPLVFGDMSNGLGVLFSIKRGWIIQPNFFNALATVTGTQGSTWSLQATAIKRGLFIPRCVAVEGGGKIFFRVDDGINMSIAGGPDQSITDQTLYPLFAHEGSTPTAIVRNGVTFFPPDDSQPQQQQFSIQNGFLYYDYLGTDVTRHTLVFDILRLAWVMDVYAHPVIVHAADEGLSVQGTLVGCSDGTLRRMASTGSETPAGTVVTAAFGGVGWQHAREISFEYSSNAQIIVGFYAADAGNGSYVPGPIIVPSSAGAPTKIRLQVGPNKWRWMQIQFQSSDPKFQIYLDGLGIVKRNWGFPGTYETIQPFSGSGGFGAQV